MGGSKSPLQREADADGRVARIGGAESSFGKQSCLQGAVPFVGQADANEEVAVREPIYTVTSKGPGAGMSRPLLKM